MFGISGFYQIKHFIQVYIETAIDIHEISVENTADIRVNGESYEPVGLC